MSGIRIWLKAVLATKPWLKDPGVIPMPYNEVSAPKKLKLGLLLDDGIVHSSPPVIRSLQEAATKLRNAGHDVIEVSWGDIHRRATEIIFRIYTQEGGVGFREQLEKSGEPLIPRVCTGWSEKPLTAMEVWLNHRKRKAVRVEYLKAWQELGLDALITAPSPHPAPPHGEYM
jgi:amidase